MQQKRKVKLLNQFQKAEGDGIPLCVILGEDEVARGVVQLMQCGWPPAFLAMFDEAWALQAAIAAMMGQVTGGNRNNMDFLAWYIDPGDGSAASPAAAGFAPHRDRQPEDWMARGLPEDPRATFRPDGTAKYGPLL